MSNRAQIAADFVKFFVDNNLAQVYGSEIGQATNKIGRSYYTVTFCRARTLDGVVQVHGDRFIVVKWQGRGRDDAGSRGTEKFDSAQAAMDFVARNWV